MNEVFLPFDHPPMLRVIDDCVAEKPFIHQDRVLDYHVLIYVEEGVIPLWEEGQEIKVYPGEALFLRAGCHHWGVEEIPAGTRWMYAHFYLEQPVQAPQPVAPGSYLRNQEFTLGDYRHALWLPKHLHADECAAARVRAKLRDLLALYRSADLYRLIRMGALLTQLLTDLCDVLERRRPLSKPDVAVCRIIDFLESRLAEPVSAEEISTHMYMNYHYLCEVFKRRTGMSIQQYHTHLRVAEGARLLRESTINISQAAERVGYRDPLYFSAVFKRVYGMSPSSYLKQSHRGM